MDGNPVKHEQLKILQSALQQEMVNLRNDQGSAIDAPSIIHPLLIDHVVEKILVYAFGGKDDEGHAHAEYLLSYRLVCKLWHGIATTLYKATSQVEVGSYSTSVPRFRKLIRIHKSHPRGVKAKSYLCWPSPFGKFRLRQEVFQPIYAPVLTDFFQTFQDSLEVLDIWLDLRSNLSDIQLNKKSRHCSFPNLKTLVYDDRRVILDRQDDGRGNILRKLVELSPNLQILSIRFQRDFRGSVEYLNEAIFNAISGIFSLKNSKLRKSLKSLMLDLHLNDQLLDCLRETGAFLESLEIAIRGSVFTYSKFRQLLEGLQRSLRILKLCYIERDSRCLISFPRMGALQQLEIQGTDGFSKHSVGFCDFTYKDNLPALQSLQTNIWASGHLKWTQLFQSRSPVWSLTELKLPGELCDRGRLACVAHTFPNLRKLQISVYSVTLNSIGVVFERMTQLEELTVMKFPSLWDRSEKNIDHILTGIDETDCDRLWNENVNLREIEKEELLLLKSGVGLIDLKNLRRLSMPDLQYQASYTDITGYLAFTRMPNLKYLNVGRSYLSSACLLVLSQKFSDMEAQSRLPPSYCKGPDDDDEDDVASYLELPGDTCVYL